jgi:hypothetical protein
MSSSRLHYFRHPLAAQGSRTRSPLMAICLEWAQPNQAMNESRIWPSSLLMIIARPILHGSQL